MRCVLDSSVAFKWTVPEADSDRANRLRDEYRQNIDEFIAPDVFPLEIAHALTRAERQARVAVGQSRTLWLDIMSTSPQLFPGVPLAIRAMEISSSMRIGFYDCLYVALAERERCELLTADVRLVTSLQGAFPYIRDLTSMP